MVTEAAFSAGVVRGFLVTMTPDGWRVRVRGVVVATGPETGAAGIRASLAAAAEAMHP